MITVANRLWVHPDFAARFEQVFSGRARQVDQMAGFVSTQVLRPVSPDAPYVVLTHWETKAAYEAWIGSPAFRAQHGGARSLPPEALTAPNVIEVHEVLADASS